MSRKHLQSTIWAWMKHYFYGCFAKSWNSSVKSVDAFLGVAIGAALDPTAIQSPNWQMAAWIFGVVYGRSVISYFAENPIPTSLPRPEQQEQLNLLPNEQQQRM